MVTLCRSAQHLPCEPGLPGASIDAPQTTSCPVHVSLRLAQSESRQPAPSLAYCVRSKAWQSCWTAAEWMMLHNEVVLPNQAL